MPEWKNTVNLPRTDFPMKANLQTAEPEAIARWEAMDLYGQIRALRRGAPKYVFHDGPPYANARIHLGHALNKILKDIVIKSLHGRFDAAYLPGYDAMPADRIEVRTRAGAEEARDVVAEVRRACREYAGRFTDVITAEFQAADGIRRLGPLLPTRTRGTSRHRARARQVRVERGWSTRASKPCTGAFTAGPALAKQKSSRRSLVAVRSTSSSRSNPPAPRYGARIPAVAGRQVSC